MNKPVLITSIVVGVVILGLIFWYLMVITAVPFSPGTPAPSPAGQQPATGGLPVVSVATTTVQVQTIPDQLASAGTQPVVAKALLSQIDNANLITLKGTSVASSYALQIWSDDNKGGEALLRYAPESGWVLISMGGGLWSTDGLVSVGVPQPIAEKLIASLELK